MSDQAKLEAIATYLRWPIDEKEDLLDILDHIWYVVIEDKLK